MTSYLLPSSGSRWSSSSVHALAGIDMATGSLSSCHRWLRMRRGYAASSHAPAPNRCAPVRETALTRYARRKRRVKPSYDSRCAMREVPNCASFRTAPSWLFLELYRLLVPQLGCPVPRPTDMPMQLSEIEVRILGC